MTRGAALQLPLVDALMREQTGLLAQHLRADERVRLITSAMHAAGFSDEASYTLFLRKYPARLLDLASQLSVGETYFFREPAQLEVFGDVVTRLLATRAKHHVLTLWSAGCASGEEAYTLAMVLDQRGLLERAEIVGTDISEIALARARNGHYGAWSLRATPKLMLQRYFRERGNEYVLSPAITRRVRFERQGLTDAEAPLPGGCAAGFDIIFCRNVLIYFTERACLDASRRLAGALAMGGTLFAGASDPFFDLPEWQRHASPACLSFTREAAARASAREPATPSPGPSQRAQASATRAPSRVSAAPIRREPTSVAGALAQVRETGKREGSAQAVITCQRALEALPEAVELQLWLAALLIELDRDEEAEQALRRLIYLDRKLVMAHVFTALLARRRLEPTRAVRAYRQVLALCAEQPADAAVPLGEGFDHGALAEHARNELGALARER